MIDSLAELFSPPPPPPLPSPLEETRNRVEVATSASHTLTTNSQSKSCKRSLRKRNRLSQRAEHFSHLLAGQSIEAALGRLLHFPCCSLISLPLQLMFMLFLVSQQEQQCMCLSSNNTNHHGSSSHTAAALLSMDPSSSSIFGSLLASTNSNNNNNNNNNNGNSAVHLQQAQLQQSAAELQHQSYKNGQTSDKVTLPGDILLGGLFPIHMKGTKVECGEINRDRGIQRLEAMLYALDKINEDSHLLPDIKLGAILLDSCSSSTYALNQSLEFIRASINTVESSAFECKDKSSPRPKYGSKMIAGVIGGSYSEVSLQVANLLRLFRIPQVSYASTGTALSDKSLYDLFARTVPSDMFQARAIADIVLKLNWSYVSLVSSEGLYGDSGSKEFMKQASVRRICIATHEKISPTTDHLTYDSIVANLLKRNATGVVLFTRAEDTRELLLAVKRQQLAQNFAWVAADGWGTHQKLVEGVEEIAWGAITVELQAKAIPGFDHYMKALTPWDNLRNPWFSEYWQEWFNCQLQANLHLQQQVAAGLTGSPNGSGTAAGSGPTSGSGPDAYERKRRWSTQAYAMQNLSSLPIMLADELAPVGEKMQVHGDRKKRDNNEQSVKQFCSPNLRINESNGYRQEQKVQFVVDAVYAMAHALHKAWFNLCDAQPGFVCEALKELNGGDFYSKYLLDVSFKDLAGSEVKFDERGDGLGRYNIYNFRQVRPSSSPPNSDTTNEFEVGVDNNLTLIAADTSGGSSAELQPALEVEHILASNTKFEYSAIGRWTEDDYYLQLDDIQFIQGDPNIPESYCSRPCDVGQAKIMRAGDHCCWICKTCAPYEFLPDEFTCRDCGIGSWPIPNKTSCFELPQKVLRWDSPFSLVSLSIACLGIIFTLFVILIFIKYLDTPVVKASGRELSFILLAGIAFCHLTTFVLLSRPTEFTCGAQRFMVNFGFALMYSSLLVKTNRISRIFNCARKSAKRPSFISPKSQMLITGVLVAIQVFLTIVWFAFEPPGIRADSPEGKRDEVVLKCKARGKSFILSLVYNMILITTCTIYAVKTRKIPENFNESKFIGFTMYTTIVIWLAFVTMFFGTNNSYEIQINTVCVCISLSAYVTLFCLFSPKISIILLHPDKNVRKLTMNSGAYKRPFKPVSSFSVDGRGNNSAAGVNNTNNMLGYNNCSIAAQADVSTTSNVLNLVESQAASRLQESSIISNVVNSNSAGSNCSTSQKTPTTLSQQLGVCASCGAHTSAVFASRSARFSDGAGRSATLLGRSSMLVATAAGQPNASVAQQASGSANASTPTSAQHQPASAQLIHSNRIAHTTHEDMNASSRRGEGTGGVAGNSGRHVSSLSRLNELQQTTSTTSSELARQCGSGNCAADESISSLANTSLENTPCRMMLMGGNTQEGASTSASANQQQIQQQQRQQQQNGRQHYISGKGSDSMLWNQSLYSIDYCSDCCPSTFCQCSCPACAPTSSNGALNGASSTFPVPAMTTSSSAQVTSCSAHGQPVEYSMTSSIGQRSTNSDSNGSALRRRRNSEEPTNRLPDGGGGRVSELPQRQQQQFKSEASHQSHRSGSSSGRASGKTIVSDTGNRMSGARRSQTMEMRTIAARSEFQQQRPQSDEDLAATPLCSKQPVMYALQAAASSALGACTLAAQIEPAVAHQHHQHTHENPYAQQYPQSGGQILSNKDKYSETIGDISSTRKKRQHQGGTILASIEMVKSNNHRLNMEAKQRRESGGCFSYQDDYEYNYCNLVPQSNSDSENYYCYEEDSGDGANTRASSIPADDELDENTRLTAATDQFMDSSGKHEHQHQYHHHHHSQSSYHKTRSNQLDQDEPSEEYDEDEEDFTHDGRLIDQHQVNYDSRYTTTERRKKRTRGTVKNRTSHSKPPSSSSRRHLSLSQHRINSVALIEATLSAGGAIVESSAPAATSTNQMDAARSVQVTSTCSTANQQQEPDSD